MTGTDIRDQLAAEIAAGHRYEVVLADPPWPYNQGYLAAPHPDKHYTTLPVDAIAALPLPDVMAPNAVVFLWTTGTHFRHALAVLDAWGAPYRTTALVWAKLNPLGVGWWSGMGYYTRANCEFCLLGVRGSRLPRTSNSVQQLIVAPRRQHSRKPDETHDRIERLYGPDVRRLELFGRQRRAGWTVLGNEVGKFAGSELEVAG